MSDMFNYFEFLIFYCLQKPTAGERKQSERHLCKSCHPAQWLGGRDSRFEELCWVCSPLAAMTKGWYVKSWVNQWAESEHPFILFQPGRRWDPPRDLSTLHPAPVLLGNVHHRDAQVHLSAGVSSVSPERYVPRCQNHGGVLPRELKFSPQSEQIEVPRKQLIYDPTRSLCLYQLCAELAWKQLLDLLFYHL